MTKIRLEDNEGPEQKHDAKGMRSIKHQKRLFLVEENKKWLFLNAFAVAVVYAAPRELSTDELITKPRPGEEYVHIQTSSKEKIDLVDKSFTTSHRIPELSKTNRSQDFQTSHRIPTHLERMGRSLTENSKEYDQVEPNQRIVYSVVEGTTSEPPLERVVTRTSIKMSKSKKVQKSVVKVPHDDLVDIKADEGLIDERGNVDEEEQEIMRKKFLKSEKVESTSEEFSPPTRFNVPFEDEEKPINFDSAHLIIPNPVIATTQEPPITTFNYKNVYDKTRKEKGFVIGNENPQGKYKYETVSSESIKTAESKSIAAKKDTKQEKKDKYSTKEKEESGFYVLPVNKQHSKFKEDNYDFVDVEEKVLVPAGSSPSQSSRINIKKGPNGQEYEYEYVYYYYDDDDESPNGGTAAKEGKVVASTTEKVYNGHDGPSKEDHEQNSVQSTSTNGNRYLPTEAPKALSKGKSKTQIEVTEEIQDDVSPQNFAPKNSRGGSNGASRFSSSSRQSEVNRQTETVNNEVYPSSQGRSQTRSRGRSSSTAAVQEEEIPSIGEERLPANTRFPPRLRANNAPATSPQPQETTARTRGREGGNQNRLRISNLGLLDSSSFRTHASDASVEDDAALRDAELQKKANARGQSTEQTYRRGTRPTTVASVETQDIPAVTRRPAIRRPVEERRPRPTTVEEEEEEIVEEKRFKAEEDERVLKAPQEEFEKRPRVPLEDESVRTPKVPLGEEQEVKRLPVPLEENGFQEQLPRNAASETPQTEERQPQPPTTRESDAEEGVFDNSQTENTDQSGNLELKTGPSTTEDPSAPGLTSAMMEKVALDLYAILQQAQNENIQTNFVDGNSTDVSTDLGEGQTEFSGEDDNYSTAEPSTTTTTTTTTTTPAPTTTTTTTTPAPTQAPGRSRYRGRVAQNGAKGRTKVSTTTTTEAPEEVSSPRTKGRFQPSHGVGARGSGLSFARKPVKQAPRGPTAQEETASEETPRAAPERTFGDRPKSRFRASGKVTTSAPSTATPSAPANVAAVSGTRGSSVDRFNSRRRGGSRTALPATQHSAAEGHTDEERQEIHQQNAGVAEEGPQPATPLRPTRPRIGGSVRPLRPGPRAPILLTQRGHQAAAASTTSVPVENEEVEKEIVETEVQPQQTNEEAPEAQVPPAGDALTRLKNRPRLRIGGSANLQRPQTPPPPPQNRRKLVSSLLPKRKPTDEKPVEKVEEVEERIIPEEIPVEEDLSSVPVEPSSTTVEPEPKGLSGLLVGRRRNLNRRPGTIYSRAQPTEA